MSPSQGEILVWNSRTKSKRSEAQLHIPRQTRVLWQDWRHSSVISRTVHSLTHSFILQPEVKQFACVSFTRWAISTWVSIPAGGPGIASFSRLTELKSASPERCLESFLSDCVSVLGDFSLIEQAERRRNACVTEWRFSVSTLQQQHSQCLPSSFFCSWHNAKYLGCVRWLCSYFCFLALASFSFYIDNKSVNPKADGYCSVCRRGNVGGDLWRKEDLLFVASNATAAESHRRDVHRRYNGSYHWAKPLAGSGFKLNLNRKSIEIPIKFMDKTKGWRKEKSNWCVLL